MDATGVRRTSLGRPVVMTPNHQGSSGRRLAIYFPDDKPALWRVVTPRVEGADFVIRGVHRTAGFRVKFLHAERSRRANMVNRGTRSRVEWKREFLVWYKACLGVVQDVTRVAKLPSTGSVNVGQEAESPDKNMSIDLKVETDTFVEHRREWSLEHAGQFVVVCGGFKRFYSSLDDALTDGYERFDDRPFLVTEVTPPDHVERVTPHF